MQTINGVNEGMKGQGHFLKILFSGTGRLISMQPRPRYRVSVYRTNEVLWLKVS